MYSPRKNLLLFLVLAALIGGASATYGGDNPLNATYQGDLTGGYLFDMGSSMYEGSVPDGGVYNVSYAIST